MLLTLALLQAAPAPGALRTFQDWIVGCDNGRACQAVALLPEDGADGATLAIARESEADATPRIWITPRAEGVPSPTALRIDGRAFPLRLDPASQELRVVDAAGAARALGQATRIGAVADEGGRAELPISPRGSAAALLHMDERQARVGTSTALVKRGTAGAPPPPPALPVVTSLQTPRTAPKRLATARVRQLLGRDATACEHAQGLDVEAFRLDARTSLVLASHPCGNGAYNLFSSAYTLDERGRAQPARFDADDGMGEAATPDHILVNADWDAAARRLSTFARGRGLGDCGTIQRYAWDGERFRLVRQDEMSECRGSTDYITTWRARVVER